MRQRLRMVMFGRPDTGLAERWLKSEGVKSGRELLDLAGGAPLLAAEWAEQGRLDAYRKVVEALADKSADPVSMAARWSVLLKGEESFAMPQLVEAVQKWVFDLIQVKMAGGLRYHQAWRDRLEPLAARATPAARPCATSPTPTGWAGSSRPRPASTGARARPARSAARRCGASCRGSGRPTSARSARSAERRALRDRRRGRRAGPSRPPLAPAPRPPSVGPGRPPPPRVTTRHTRGRPLVPR